MNLDRRFIVIGAATMLELINSMNVGHHPLARVVYFGRNDGDYSLAPDKETIDKAVFIAVFDYAPMSIYDVGDVTISGNDDTLYDDSHDMKITLSA